MYQLIHPPLFLLMQNIAFVFTDLCFLYETRAMHNRFRAELINRQSKLPYCFSEDCQCKTEDLARELIGQLSECAAILHSVEGGDVAKYLINDAPTPVYFSAMRWLVNNNHIQNYEYIEGSKHSAFVVII